MNRLRFLTLFIILLLELSISPEIGAKQTDSSRQPTSGDAGYLFMYFKNNGATHSQLTYLAKVSKATKSEAVGTVLRDRNQSPDFFPDAMA